MNIINLLPNEPLNDENIYLTLHGPGCGIFGKTISYAIGEGNLGYTFTGLEEDEEYYFYVEMYDWVEVTGTISNFGELIKQGPDF